MDAKSKIAALKARLAKAENERDTWRAAGGQENYLAAYSMVEALELQLDQLEGITRFPPAADVHIAIAARAASPAAQGRDMAKLSITYTGRSYAYRGYRYDHLVDAVDYARLDRSRAFVDPGADDAAPLERLPVPSAADLDLMRTLGISYADGAFHWREYRYDRLADAIAYARRGDSS
jgi:hypothetical protein